MIQGHLNFQFDFFSTDPGFPTSRRIRITSKAIHWKYIHQNESGLMRFPLFGTHGKTVNLVTVFPCVRLKGNYINPLSFRCHSALIPLYVFAVYLNWHWNSFVGKESWNLYFMKEMVPTNTVPTNEATTTAVPLFTSMLYGVCLHLKKIQKDTSRSAKWHWQAVGHWVLLCMWSVVGWLIVYQDGNYLQPTGQYSQTICRLQIMMVPPSGQEH